MYTVNHAVIEEKAILHEMQYHPADNAEQAKQKASEALIIAELLKQRAVELKLSINDSEDYIDALLEREVHIPEASREDCENYYRQNQQKFHSSPLLDIKHILLACAPEDVSARSENNEIARQLIALLEQDPERFGMLAKQYSRCPSAESGGNLGQLSSGQTVPEFERQLFQSEQGLLTTPIESRYGVHVVFVSHREDARQLPFELVAERIADYLNKKVRHVAIKQYITSLADKARIEGFEFSSFTEPFHH